MKKFEIITEIRNKKDLKKVLSNMILSRIQKDVDKILEGGGIKFIRGGIKRTIKEMPEDLKLELMVFYDGVFETVLTGIQKDEYFNTSVLTEKDSVTLEKLNTYLESRFE